MNVIVWVLWCLGSSGGVECCDQDFTKMDYYYYNLRNFCETNIFIQIFLNSICDWFAPKYRACAVGIFQYFCLYTRLRFSNNTEKNYQNWNKVGDWS